ncbi:MAG: histidine phosphatase family protein [Proteobacteria bacterium]|nr:histidine phosphatase family protein [Pseudomonadota bacterium]
MSVSILSDASRVFPVGVGQSSLTIYDPRATLHSMLDRLSRLILVRHGETEGQSSIRYYGVTDVPLSEFGREQALRARHRIPGETFEAVWASSLCRAWKAAQIIAPGHSVRIEFDFREIDFGRWEGLTLEEIEAVDPVLFAQWQEKRRGFEFPDGETRPDFRRRIERGLARLRATGASSALVVAHKGVVRTLLELVSGQTLGPEMPELGGVIHVSRNASGDWSTGRRGSDSSCGEAPVGIPMIQSTP